MKRLLVAGVVLLFFSMSFAAEEETLDAFLLRARKGNTAETFASLEGTLIHRRRGSDSVEMPIYFGVIVRPQKSSGQLILDGRESCLIGQSHENGVSTLVPQNGSTALFDRVGLQATDLTLGFIYFPVLEECEATTIGGFVPCRVILFSVPERPGETVRVAFSKEYAFPLKAEFFRAGEKTPFRSVEVSGFTQKNELYYAKRILMEGPGWRTRIDFDRAEVGTIEGTPPANIIRRPPEDPAQKGN